MPLKYMVDKEFMDDLILHYTGDKPWRDFTYAWAEWWEVYNQSIFKDGMFYHNICSKLLSPKYQLKSIRRKAKEKCKQFRFKHFGA